MKKKLQHPDSNWHEPPLFGTDFNRSVCAVKYLFC